MERLDIEKQRQEIKDNIREAQALYEYYYERGDLSRCEMISNALGYYYDELNELNEEE